MFKSANAGMVWVGGTIKQFNKVYIKIVKTTYRGKTLSWKRGHLWFLLFNDKKMGMGCGYWVLGTGLRAAVSERFQGCRVARLQGGCLNHGLHG